MKNSLPEKIVVPIALLAIIALLIFVLAVFLPMTQETYFTGGYYYGWYEDFEVGKKYNLEQGTISSPYKEFTVKWRDNQGRTLGTTFKLNSMKGTSDSYWMCSNPTPKIKSDTSRNEVYIVFQDCTWKDVAISVGFIGGIQVAESVFKDPGGRSTPIDAGGWYSYQFVSDYSGGGECAPGATKCKNNKEYECLDNEWAYKKTCPSGYVCDALGKKCIKDVNVCVDECTDIDKIICKTTMSYTVCMDSDGDGCTERTTKYVTDGYICKDGKIVRDDTPECGNGIIEEGEVCDGSTATYTCSSDCQELTLKNPCKEGEVWDPELEKCVAENGEGWNIDWNQIILAFGGLLVVGVVLFVLFLVLIGVIIYFVVIRR